MAPSRRMLSIERRFSSDVGIELKEQHHANIRCVGPRGVLSNEKSVQSMNHTNAQGLFMIQSSALEMVWKNVSCGLRLRHLSYCCGIPPNISRSKHSSFQSYSAKEKRLHFFFRLSTFEHFPALNQFFKVIRQDL